MIYDISQINIICLVRIRVVDHEPSPLSHLAQVTEGVVEVLDGCDVRLRLQVEGELEARLVAEDAGEDGDVASLIEHLQLLALLLRLEVRGVGGWHKKGENFFIFAGIPSHQLSNLLTKWSAA